MSVKRLIVSYGRQDRYALGGTEGSEGALRSIERVPPFDDSGRIVAIGSLGHLSRYHPCLAAPFDLRLVPSDLNGPVHPAVDGVEAPLALECSQCGGLEGVIDGCWGRAPPP